MAEQPTESAVEVPDGFERSPFGGVRIKTETLRRLVDDLTRLWIVDEATRQAQENATAAVPQEPGRLQKP